ncbi:hypothetical protein WKI71_04395 [Streptomyces sp. MS1.AVA.1]|uniref:Exo-alpha-sialidase n=2 Tax=Streptomyces TaxID=1883 RepID=A0ABU8UHV1_9ACTN
MSRPWPGFRVIAVMAGMVVVVVVIAALANPWSDDRPEGPAYDSWAQVSGTRLPEGFETRAAAATPYGFVVAGMASEEDPSAELGFRLLPKAFVSSDGRTWQAADLGPAGRNDDLDAIGAVAMSGKGGFLVASGRQTTQVWTSKDGRRWTPAAGAGRGTPPPAGILHGAAGTDTGVVALIQPTDDPDQGADTDVEIWASVDGWTWGRVAQPLPRQETEVFELGVFSLDDQVMTAGYRQDPPPPAASPDDTPASVYSPAAWTSRDGSGAWMSMANRLPGALWPTAALTYQGSPLICGATVATPERTRAMDMLESPYDVHGPPACWTRNSDDSWKRTGRFGTGQLPDPTAVPLTEQRLSSVVDVDGTLIGVGAANLPDGKRTVGAVWTSRDGRTWSELAAADNDLASSTATIELRHVLRHDDTVIAVGKEETYRDTEPYHEEYTRIWIPKP